MPDRNPTRMIDHVESFRAELQFLQFANRELPHQPNVAVHISFVDASTTGNTNQRRVLSRIDPVFESG